MDFYKVEEALEELKLGNMVIVVDKPDRENQGDLIFSAKHVSPAKINFMFKNCHGMICVPLTKKQAIQFELPLMVAPFDNTEQTGVSFTVTVDAKRVSDFGVSVRDQALTIATLADAQTKSDDLVRPGHTFPLLCADGGILEREGHTEATIELLKLAGLPTVGVLCEILKDNGEVAKLADLVKFAKRHNLKLVSISDLITFVKKNSKQSKAVTPSVVKTAASILATKYGVFQMLVYRSIEDGCEHAVLKLEKYGIPFVRLHSRCLTGDTFGSLRCDCGGQLDQSLKLIGKKGGLILYLNQEGRGIGLTNKIKAYFLQDQGIDTVEANLDLGLPIDARDYQVAADILKDLGISKIKLLTNNPQKKAELEKFGIKVTKEISVEVVPNKVNLDYLLVKKQKLGHKLIRV